MLGAERFGTKNAQLIKAEQNNQNAADPCEQQTVPAEEPACRSEPEAQQEKSEADTQYEKDGVDQHTFARIIDLAVSVLFFCAACQISHIKRNQRQDTRGKEAEKSLQKDRRCRNT